MVLYYSIHLKGELQMKAIHFTVEEHAIQCADYWCTKSVAGVTHCYAYITQDSEGGYWVHRSKSWL